MRILTVLGTRPEIIRLSKTVKLIDELIGVKNHFLFWTGQNGDSNLSDIFFDEFGIRDPDVKMRGTGGSFSGQISNTFPIFDDTLRSFQPNKVLVLGDTNSSLLAIVAERNGFPVYHVEAGNRTYGPKYAEEVNRRIIDSISSVHMCYNERARMNLLREGIPIDKTYVVGNPIHELLGSINPRKTLSEGYVLVTIHRQETVDDVHKLRRTVNALKWINEKHKIVSCLHPRTVDRLSAADIQFPGEQLGSIGWHRFVNKLNNASCVVTDSGTVQEEAAFLGVPCVIAREAHERHAEMELGGSILDPDFNLGTVEMAIGLRWSVGRERPMLMGSPSGSIVSILLGRNHG